MCGELGGLESARKGDSFRVVKRQVDKITRRMKREKQKEGIRPDKSRPREAGKAMSTVTVPQEPRDELTRRKRESSPRGGHR